LSHVSKSAVGSRPSLSLAPVGSPLPFGMGQSLKPSPSHYRRAFAFSDFLYPLSRPPSLRLGYHRVVPVGFTQLTSEKRRRKADGTCSPVGIGGILRESSMLSERPTAFWHCLSASLAVNALRAFNGSFTVVHPFPPPLALGQMRLPAFGSLSPELRTLDYSAARLSRGTWMPQGPVARHFPSCPCEC
jgi:hypothetical protein